MNSQHFLRIAGELSIRNIPYKFDSITVFLKIRRLAKRHDRLAEMSCNGEGSIRGTFWRLDSPKAYVSEDRTVFDVESDKVEAKIKELADSVGVSTDFQGDPRGYTVKLALGDVDITHLVLQ